MGRIARSWDLMKRSWAILMKDKELMILPILSGACMLIVLASFAAPVVVNGEGWLDSLPDWALYTAGFVFYVITYTLTFFFQAAIIAGASERMAGGDPTLRSALGAAGRRFPSLLMWGVVAATVGMIIRAIEERSEFVGRIAMALVGAAWSLATFFMVPVLVMERKSLGASFKASWGIFKETWGETVVGAGGLGIAGFLLSLPVMLLAGWLVSTGMVWLGVAIGVLGLGTISVVFSALQGVYVAAVYRYATVKEAPTGFDADALRDAFRPKKK